MEDENTTPVKKTESECRCAERIIDLERRVANLEARKPPQDTTPDPEWFS